MDNRTSGNADNEKNKLSNLKDKILNSEGFFYTFLRSSVSSQVCGWIDYLISFIAFSIFNLTVWLSTAVGAFVGGVFNCLINYKFTFHTKGVELRAALTKFAFVWAGSLLLNSFGTQFVYYFLRDWKWLKEFPEVTDDGIFLAARLFVALMVSLCWNFLLQRNFVFKANKIDKYIIAALNHIGLTSKKMSNK